MNRRKLLGVLLALVGAGLTLLATFLPLFSGEASAGPVRLSMSITAWGFTVSGSGGTPMTQIGVVPVNAYPMILAVVLLLAGAVVAVLAAGNLAAPASRRASVVMTSIAAAFTAGTGFTVALEAVSWADSFHPTTAATRIGSSGVGLGFWCLVAATALAIGAAVLTALPVRQPDPPTPPYGIPVLPPPAADTPADG